MIVNARIIIINVLFCVCVYARASDKYTNISIITPAVNELTTFYKTRFNRISILKTI